MLFRFPPKFPPKSKIRSLLPPKTFPRNLKSPRPLCPSPQIPHLKSLFSNLNLSNPSTIFFLLLRSHRRLHVVFIRFDLAGLRRWVLGFCIIRFDPEQGQTVEVFFPPNSFTADQQFLIAFSSFPDSMHQARHRSLILDSIFTFRFPASSSFVYGYVFNRQRHDLRLLLRLRLRLQPPAIRRDPLAFPVLVRASPSAAYPHSAAVLILGAF